mgnify:CR=1 FL=1
MTRRMARLRHHLSRSWLYGLSAIILIFLVTPAMIVVPMSFSDNSLLAFPPASWSLRWYRAYLASDVWTEATQLSLLIAFLTASLATPLGASAAWGIQRARPRMEPALLLALAAPVMVPIILVAVGTFYVYARIGLVNSITGVVIAHTMLAIPFVVTVVIARLRTFDFEQMNAAAIAGASPLVAFLTIAVPQLRATFITAALLAFLTSLDEVVMALFISGGAYSTLTKVMFTNLRDQIDPIIAVVSTLLVAISILVVSLYQLLQLRPARRGLED